MVLSIAIVLFVVFINYITAGWFSEIAEIKGYDSKQKHIFARCFWLGVIGWLYTIALPNQNISYSTKVNSDNDTNTENKNFSTTLITSKKINDGSWTCKTCGKVNSEENKVCASCNTVNYDLWGK